MTPKPSSLVLFLGFQYLPSPAFLSLEHVHPSHGVSTLAGALGELSVPKIPQSQPLAL